MHVVVHNAVSVDGRIDGFVPDVGRYYALASAWPVDAHLVGVDTLVEGLDLAGGDDAEGPSSPDDGRPVEFDADPTADPDAEPPLLVVTDSRGRVAAWDAVLAQPYWTDVLVLCSETTPASALERLADRAVPHLVVGPDRVDLGRALARLADRGVETVLVDSGGTLSGVLLREGLVDEVSVLVQPVLVGGTSARPFVRGPDSTDGATDLELLAVERPGGDALWLRYAVVG